MQKMYLPEPRRSVSSRCARRVEPALWAGLAGMPAHMTASHCSCQVRHAIPTGPTLPCRQQCTARFLTLLHERICNVGAVAGKSVQLQCLLAAVPHYDWAITFLRQATFLQRPPPQDQLQRHPPQAASGTQQTSYESFKPRNKSAEYRCMQYQSLPLTVGRAEGEAQRRERRLEDRALGRHDARQLHARVQGARHHQVGQFGTCAAGTAVTIYKSMGRR